ncbi:MAG: hypothetical protein AB8B69_04695 [Chitinophagales bacterium]
MVCFSKEEWSNLGHFLKLPYLNKVYKKHREIYGYLKTYYWLQKKRKTDSKTLFPSSDTLNSKFFPDAKDFKPLNKHLSTLHKNARLFLASEKAMNTPQEVDLISVERAISASKYHYAKLDLDNTWEKVKQETDDWYLRYQFALNKGSLNLRLKRPNRIASLEVVEKSLDDFYILAKLINYCHQLSAQQSLRNFKINENQKIFEAYLDYYHSQRNYHPIFFQIYYSILNIFRNKQVQLSIKAIDSILVVHKEKFPPEKLMRIRSFLLSHCTHLLHAQQTTPSKVLKIYQMLLDSGILSTKEGSFKLNYYVNILILAIRTEAFDWLKEEFIPKYTKMLLPEYQKTAINYGDAEYYLSQKDWKKAFDSAYKIPAWDKNFKFLRGATIIQAAYEMEKINFNDLGDKYYITTVIQNFKSQLTYKKNDNSSQVKAYKNFTNFVQRIHNLEKAKNKYERAFKLKKIIQEEKLVARKAWLNEKLNRYLT